MSNKLMPVVQAEEAEEEELVNPQEELRATCHETPECQKLWEKYLKCNERVLSKSKTAETCEEEVIDYVMARDSCVGKDLFKRLK